MNESRILKQPVIKNKLEINLNNPAGDIIEEISEQDVYMQIGGLSPTIVSLTATILTLLSAASAGVIKNASDSAENPGRYCTVSAECLAGVSCG